MELPEIPLDMSVCDNEDFEVKQEPMGSDEVEHEEFAPEFPPESQGPHSDSQDVLADAQIQSVTESSKLYVIELETKSIFRFGCTV